MELERNFIECVICLEMLCRPSSTPCGHNFCLPCLEAFQRSKVSQVRCPLCRYRIPNGKFAVNKQLEILIQKTYPKEYAWRLKNFKPKFKLTRAQIMFLGVCKTVRVLFVLVLPVFMGVWLSKRLDSVPRQVTNFLSLIFRIILSAPNSCILQLFWNLANLIFRYLDVASAVSGLMYSIGN